MTQEEFNKCIEEYGNRDLNPMGRITRKGCIAFALRVATTYPELAKAYYDALPKVTMD